MTLHRRGVLAGAIGGLARSAAAAAPAPDDWLPIRLDAQHIRVRARLNGESFAAIIDSGAAGSVLDVRMARRLGLRIHGGLTAQGVGASAAGGTAGPVDLQLGAVAWTLPQIAVVDLSAVRLASDDTFVILGRDLFEHRVVRFDFARARMRLDAPAALDRAYGEFVPLRPTPHGLRSTSVVLGSATPCAAEFDLGNGSALLVSRSYANAHGLLAGKRTSSWISAGVEGVTRYVTATLDRLRLGSATFANVPIDVYDAWSTPEVPVNLGLPLLSRFDLATDYPSNRLWLDAGARTSAPFARDRSGLACRWDGAALQVLHVAEDSPAARAGWSPNDRITRVDGVPASPAALGWGQGAAGATHTLTLSDGTPRRLTLQDYY